MASPGEHDLPEPYLAQRFADRVASFVFGQHQPSPAPVLILVAGQPAAGKTLAMTRLAHRHADQDLVMLTGDALRQFHPHTDQLLATDPLAVPNATAQASGAWVRMSIQHALAHRFSLLLEGTFRDPAAVTDTIRRFAAAGYRTEVVVLAVRAERSRLDSLLRHRFTPDDQPGRWTPPAAHDIAYQRLPGTVAAVEAVTELDRIRIVARDGTNVYTNHRGPDRQWQRPDSAHEALTAYRGLPLPKEDAQAWLRQYRRLFDQLHRDRRVDPRAMRAYVSLHADAAVVAAMANPNPTEAERIHYASAQALDGLLLRDLAGQTNRRDPNDPPRTGRAFPRPASPRTTTPPPSAPTTAAAPNLPHMTGADPARHRHR